jgi:hypothetical protein
MVKKRWLLLLLQVIFKICLEFYLFSIILPFYLLGTLATCENEQRKRTRESQQSFANDQGKYSSLVVNP